jgi:DNA-binding NtrC family response regulator
MNDAGNDPEHGDGMRILMVEDEMVVAMSLEDLLTVIGHQVVKAANVRQALAAVASESFDGALLDYNLRGENASPVIEALERRDIPLAIMTGYSPADIQAEWPDLPLLQKPFDSHALEHIIDTTFAAAAKS